LSAPRIILGSADLNFPLAAFVRGRWRALEGDPNPTLRTSAIGHAVFRPRTEIRQDFIVEVVCHAVVAEEWIGRRW